MCWWFYIWGREGANKHVNHAKKNVQQFTNIIWFPVRFHHLFKIHICKIFVRRTEMGLLDRVIDIFLHYRRSHPNTNILAWLKIVFISQLSFELQLCIIIGLSSTDIKLIQAYRTVYSIYKPRGRKLLIRIWIMYLYLFHSYK